MDEKGGECRECRKWERPASKENKQQETDEERKQRRTREREERERSGGRGGPNARCERRNERREKRSTFVPHRLYLPLYLRLSLLHKSGNDNARPQMRLPRLHFPFSSLPDNRVLPRPPSFRNAQRIQKLLRLVRHERLKEDSGESKRFGTEKERAVSVGKSGRSEPRGEVLEASVDDGEDVEDSGEGAMDLEGGEVGGEGG